MSDPFSAAIVSEKHPIQRRFFEKAGGDTRKYFDLVKASARSAGREMGIEFKYARREGGHSAPARQETA